MRHEAEPEVRQVGINQLVRGKIYQIRKELDKGTIKRYAEVYKTGKNIEPVRVSLVNGVLVLVDGWHRVSALEMIGRETVDAIITNNTETEALWLAAKANLGHGLPLKPSEVRRVFRAYIRTKQHIKPRNRHKSYREIAVDIGRPHTTIRHWMIKDFPKIARRMGDTDEFRGKGEPEGLYQSDNREPAIQGLEEVYRTFQSMADPAARGEVINHVEQMLQAMKASSGWVMPEQSDF